MKLHFRLQFFTQWGQELLLFAFAADNQVSETHPMQHTGNGWWELTLETSESLIFSSYRYGIRQPDGSMMYETGLKRTLRLPFNGLDVAMNDQWRGPSGDAPFNASLFADLFFKRTTSYTAPNHGRLHIRLHCPAVEPDKYLAITGNQEILGNWNSFLRLDESNFPDWTITLPVTVINFPLEYKYVLVNAADNGIAEWEDGDNRKVEYADDNHLTVLNDEHFRRKSIPFKAAGVAIPVFSLRSKKSFGTGEFEDLRLMVDWAEKTGLRIIQTLPVNDTILNRTNRDSYPYNAVSVYALHPLYLNPYKTGKLNDKLRRQYFEEKRKALNALPTVAYQQVMELKWEYFNELYQQEGASLFRKKAYLSFFETNKEWLVPYAAFSYLRDLNGTPDTRKWGKYSTYNSEKIAQLSSESSEVHEKIAFYYFLQYHLHKQLSEVHEYALSKKVALKGDIPIGVSPQSVDVWMEPELFNLHVQAGAPPDDFSVTGQNWGFPTYNWELMAQDGYSWWKKRFAKMADYFDAYRIDHILGFFRIWEIPSGDVWGLKGYFNPALPLTVDELTNAGINRDEERLTQPFITDELLHVVFAEMATEVADRFLLKNQKGNYSFKEEYNTQRKIKAYFSGTVAENDNNTLFLRDGLYRLHCELLFVADAKQAGCYHPRISLADAYSFSQLSSEQQEKLRALHDDYFYRRHNDFWKENAYVKLPALLEATRMLVCGEDLGMVPDSVPEVMKALEILSLEIQRMPKTFGREFGVPAEAPYLSVVTTSTHDMNPIRAWWEENPELTQRFYNQVLGHEGKAPQRCEAKLAQEIIEQHLKSNAMWTILPWQDWVAMDEKLWRENVAEERINVPDNPKNIWCYRMHIGLEELLKMEEFLYSLQFVVSSK